MSLATLVSSTQSSDSVPGLASSAFRDARVHMIGVGGCGMSGLAAILLRHGARVSGSDAKTSVEVIRLMEHGARVTQTQTAEALPEDAELVVASAAIPDNQPELAAARARGIPIMKYAQLLGALMNHYDGIAISGTHGKSTTTAWLAYTLKRAGREPNFVVGANVDQLGGGSGVGNGPHFVAEACEFDRSFLNMRPKRAVVLNIEEDHLDCYTDLAAIRAAFGQFAGQIAADGLLVLNGDDARCRALAGTTAAQVETFGLGNGNDWQASNLALQRGAYAFDVIYHGRRLGRAQLGLSGKHNVSNALAVIALAHACQIPWEVIAESLNHFRGAQRRLELRGDVNGVRVVDDYAHHPTEIRATLEAVRERYAPTKLWCVFQPHQHSRTRFLLADFARSFAQADQVVVPDIYFVRDSERERELVSALDLVDQIRARDGNATHIASFEEIAAVLAREVRPGDLVLTMGAGNIWKVADELVKRLRAGASD